MLRSLLPVVPLLCLVALARAEINIVDSVEWMTVDADAVLRVKLPEQGPLRLEIAEVMKGPANGGWDHVALPPEMADAARRTGHMFLLFLRPPADPPTGRAVAGWVLRNTGQGMVDLEKPQGVYSADMKELQDGLEILKLVRKWATWNDGRIQPLATGAQHGIRVGPPGSLRLDIPPDAPIFRKVYAGSACYITVPAEEKYHERAMKLIASTQPHDRAEGAELLAAFPGQETVKALTALLDDKADTMSILGGTNISFSYRVRPAAYEALLALGQKPAKPEYNRVPTPDERIRVLRGYWWQDRLGPILPAGWLLDDVTIADAPAGWTHAKGGDGLALLLRQPKETLHDPMVGDYHPSLTVFVMSSDWEGENKHYKGEKIAAGKYTPPQEQFADAQVYPARYIGQKEGYVRVFVTTVGRGAWDTADDQIGKRLELKK